MQKYTGNKIFLIDKAIDRSSAAELAKLKKKLNLNKAGHAGTLDPLATGLLVCLGNSATRLASFAEKGTKTYTGKIKFGITTSTDDIRGDVISRSEELPDEASIKSKSSGFIGVIEQTPPDISAVKVSGVRSYKISRSGQKPKLTSRKVNVFNFELNKLDGDEIDFKIECSAGTYIRSIARDLGSLLGCGACISSLRRERSFPFDVKNAKTIDDIKIEDGLDWVDLFPDMDKVCFDKTDSVKLSNGAMNSLRPRLGELITKQISKEAKSVIYFEENFEKPKGILENNLGTWEIAINL